jgi:hypothetical protein
VWISLSTYYWSSCIEQVLKRIQVSSWHSDASLAQLWFFFHPWLHQSFSEFRQSLKCTTSYRYITCPCVPSRAHQANAWVVVGVTWYIPKSLTQWGPQFMALQRPLHYRVWCTIKYKELRNQSLTSLVPWIICLKK